MKEKRQKEILSIVTSQDVETQEQLLYALRARGVDATQATISRDMKELHLVKELTQGGRYRYAVAEQKELPVGADHRLRTIFHEAVVSCDYAQNLVVVKTMPGLAGAAGAALDSMAVTGLVGSLAGDDTVLLILRTTDNARNLCVLIREMLS